MYTVPTMNNLSSHLKLIDCKEFESFYSVLYDLKDFSMNTQNNQEKLKQALEVSTFQDNLMFSTYRASKYVLLGLNFLIHKMETCYPNK